MRKIALFVSGLVLGVRCLGLSVSSGPVVPGVWVNCFADAKAYAERESLPMIAIYSDPDCGFCRKLDKALSNAAFVEWQTANKIVMVYCKGLGGEGAACRNFARNEMMAYPYVAFYWAKADGKTVKDKFPGRVGYMPSRNGSSVVSQLTGSLDDFLAGWSGAGSGAPSGTPNPGPSAENTYVKSAFATVMPVFAEGREWAGPDGLLTLAGTSAGKVSAKYQQASRTTKESFNLGKWTTDAAGVATVSGESRGGTRLVLTLTPGGLLTCSMRDGAGEKTGQDVDLTKTGFADYLGDYAVALPSAESNGNSLGIHGCAAFTIKMSSPTAAKKGLAKVAILYPDGKTTSASAQMISSSDGRVRLPVSKMTAKNLVSVQLAFARPSASARNCVVSDEVRGGGFAHDDARIFSSRTRCAAYGSQLDAGLVGREDASAWEFALDGDDALASERYGDLVSVAWPKKVSLARTGLAKGTVALAFTRQKSVKGKFMCVFLPGWERELGVKALGPGWYVDKQGGVSTTRMLTVGAK